MIDRQRHRARKFLAWFATPIGVLELIYVVVTFALGDGTSTLVALALSGAGLVSIGLSAASQERRSAAAAKAASSP